MELVATLARRKADALMIAHHSEDDAPYDMLRALGVPVVLVDRERPEWADAVIVDHSDAIRQATERLFALGHRRIALVTGHPPLYPSRARIAAFAAAHRARGVPLVAEFIRDASSWPTMRSSRRRSSSR